MADLEDSFLKSNVPGRYSTWADDAEGGGNKREIDDDSETDDEYYFRDAPDVPGPRLPLQPPSMRRTGNTGVKGVIADYNEARQRKALDEAEERLERLEILRGATGPARQGRHSPRDSAADREDGQHSDDDEFVKNYRTRRMSQLRDNATLPSYGVYSRATPEEYCDLTDSIDPRCHLIVHLCEGSILPCRRLDSALDKLALCMPRAKFIRVDALEANPNLDAICLPAVLVYKSGELKHNLVRFTDELPRDFTVEDVREVLEGIGVIDPDSTDGAISGDTRLQSQYISFES
ncbi:hypothetical protein THAOC_09728 [Thalassiosira oceanica]|uniref:Phosducin domain-containing protein n=1 Tax=Thalassiosira oceanica TaxID=159749 RepID=K0SVT3_THAOC|nr:hypothetical protein THAOC_09728 [Thalassiosira oceanica]|eukprot:EJK69054.1 hypothetical protein THAOC_09728 [Thalassiosira oceanica]